MSTLEEARDWLRGQSATGARCPCCRQFVKVYRRKLNSSMARWLIRWHRATEGDCQFHKSSIIHSSSGEWGVLRNWTLIEPNDDWSMWRQTEIGRLFVENRAVVPSHAVIYDNRCLRVEGDSISIVRSLGRKFDYNELMGERPISGEPQ